MLKTLRPKDLPSRTRAPLLATLALAVSLAFGGGAWASSPAVPPRLQATLTAKLAAFDRALDARAEGSVSVIVLSREGNAGSARTASAFTEGLRSISNIAGMPHREVSLVYSTPAALVELIHREKASIVYFSEGFEEIAPDIAAALDGGDVLTVAAEVEAVKRGIVVGFDLVSGQSKLLVNFPQSKRQGVRFRADLLRIAVIIEGP
jgi:hypothetical protein